MMEPLRTAGIWLGVGAGHVAVLVATWGGAAPSEPSDGDPLALLLVSTESPPALVAEPIRTEPIGTGSPARPVPFLAPVAAAVPVPAPAAAADAPMSAPAQAVPGEPPGFVDHVEPLYPRNARLAGVEGVVRLRLRVGADGTLSRVVVAASSGDAALDRAAVEAASASTYRPARIGGRAVEAEAEASYRFELR